MPQGGKFIMVQLNWHVLTSTPTSAQQILNHIVGRDAGGRLEVFYQDQKNEFWYVWQLTPDFWE